MNRRSDPLHNLADALSEDVAAASPEMLAAEAAQEHDAGAGLAHAFDRVVGRAERQARWRRAGAWLRSLAPSTSLRSWRPAMAAVAGVAIIVVASDLFLHVRSAAPGEPSQAHEPLSSDISASRPRSYREEGDGDLQANAPAAAPVPASADAPRRVPTVPIRGAAEATTPGQDLATPSAAPGAKPRPVKTVRIPAAVDAPSPAPTPAPPTPPQTAARTLDQHAMSLAEQGTQQDQRLRLGSRAASAPPPADQPAANGGVTPSFTWPLSGRLVADMRAAKADKRDAGIDIAVPVGTDVHASADGVVTFAGDDLKSFGNVILVRHDGGFVTAYAHLDKILVKVDDHVQRGQVIATSGATGTVATPMLRFEIRQGSTVVDARQYLSAN